MLSSDYFVLVAQDVDLAAVLAAVPFRITNCILLVTVPQPFVREPLAFEFVSIFSIARPDGVRTHDAMSHGSRSLRNTHIATVPKRDQRRVEIAGANRNGQFQALSVSHS